MTRPSESGPLPCAPKKPATLMIQKQPESFMQWPNSGTFFKYSALFYLMGVPADDTLVDDSQTVNVLWGKALINHTLTQSAWSTES